METSRPDERFVQQLIACQGRLFAYILSLLGDMHRAEDVLQEVNLVLWRKADEFDEGTEFGAWACRVAYFQCLAHRQKHGRDKLLFDDALLEEIAEQARDFGEGVAPRLRALRRCLAEISPRNRDLLLKRYADNASVAAMASELGRPVETVYQMLYRIRTALRDCIARHLSDEGED